MDLLHLVVDFFLDILVDFGYLGIIALMFLESSFVPFPSEVVIIPAGYLAYKGDMSLWLIIASGTIGSLLGAVFNYYLAMMLGRPFLIKFGKYFLFKEHHLEKIEIFFTKYGNISTFIGRLIMGVRQYISLPAGLSKMNILKFCFFTIAGAFIWVLVLALLGYYLGENEILIKEYLRAITISIVALSIFVIFWYFRFKKTYIK